MSWGAERSIGLLLLRNYTPIFLSQCGFMTLRAAMNGLPVPVACGNIVTQCRLTYFWLVRDLEELREVDQILLSQY